MRNSFGLLQPQPMSTETLLTRSFLLVVGIAVREFETERDRGTFCEGFLGSE